MIPTFSSMPMAIVIAASAGLMLTACGTSDLTTALPSLDSATLVATTDSTAAVSEDSDLPPILEDLDLTETQRQQAEQLRLDTQAQIRTLLTPDQIALLDAFEGDDREAFRALQQDLNLTEAQRQQISEIVSGSRQAFRDLLTPEQIATLGQARSPMAGLEFSETQQQQIDQIRLASREQIRALLTPEQIEALESLPGSDPGTFGALRQELNLTEAQQEQIQIIRQEAREQIKALLDLDQQEALQEFKQGSEERRAHRSRIFNG